MEQQLLLKRLRWFLISRLMVAITGLIAIWIYQKGQWAFPPHILAIYLILIFACFINIFYFLVLKWIRHPVALRIAALVQVGIDILLVSALCYFTGGINSIFAYLYFAAIVTSALLISAQAGLGFASLATVLLAGITLAYTLSARLHFVMPLIPEKYLLATAREIRFILPYLFFFGLSLHLVAWLAGRLTIELAREKILKADILQNMLHGLIVVDSKGKVAFWNPKASEMLRLTPETKLTGEPIDKILEDAQYKHLRTALLNNLRVNQTLEFRDKKGEMVFLEINTSVLEDKQKRLRGMIAILTDITFKKQMEEVIKQSERLQSLQEMSASLAHEVRNPLASIKGAVQALKNYLSDSLKPDEHKLMDLVIKESDRLNKIVTDFLDFASKKPMIPRRTNLTEVVDEVITLLKRIPTFVGTDQAGKTIHFETDIAPSLFCECDPEGLKQVFLNLGLNALEASPPNATVTFKGYWSTQNAPLETAHDIQPNVAPDDGYVKPQIPSLGITFEVIDQGSGIKQEYRGRVFEPFFTTKPKGVGLGLSVAYKIIQEHRGEIWCESRPGSHTRFIIWLPLQTLPQTDK